MRRILLAKSDFLAFIPQFVVHAEDDVDDEPKVKPDIGKTKQGSRTDDEVVQRYDC